MSTGTPSPLPLNSESREFVNAWLAQIPPDEDVPPDELADIEAMLGLAEAASDAAPAAEPPTVETPPQRWLAETLGDVAIFLGVELQTVKQWRSGPDPMPGREGAWPLDEIARWRINRVQQRSTSEKKRALEEEEYELNNSRLWLKLQKDAGQLVSREAVLAELEQVCNEIRGRLEAIPAECVATIPPELRADVLELWNESIALTLRGLERVGECLLADEPAADAADVEPAE